MKLLQILCALCLASLLVACGGGGGVALGALVGAALPDSSSTNKAPVANAGVTQNISLGYANGIASKVVFLNGTNSSDANGDAITFKWFLTQKPAGSLAELSSVTEPNPTFTADVAGIYKVSLIVNDGKLSSTADPISITVSAANSVPVAAAGADQYVLVSAQVTLDGSGSTDADKLDTLSYKWTLNKPVGSTASLSSATAQKPTFTADTEGVYVASLVVNDSKSDSLNQSLTRITASTVANSPPVANAGTAQTVTTTATVTLAGSATDANSDTLTYKWYLVTKPTGSSASLSLSTTTAPTFTPDQVGIYVVVLIANDGKVDSAPSSVTITRSL